MIGTLINSAAIAIGSLLGLLIRKGIKESLKKLIMQSIGLCVILIGIQGALKTEQMLLMILSMSIGGFVGNLINLDNKLERLGSWTQHKLTRNQQDDQFAKGFVTASMIFCVGAMAVVGALDSSIRGDHSTLIAKAMLDGITSIVLAGSLGAGVMLSAVAVLVYQGVIALFGTLIAPLLTAELITEVSAIGGLLITAIGINMVLDSKIKVMNLLPALLVPAVYFPIYHIIVR